MTLIVKYAQVFYISLKVIDLGNSLSLEHESQINPELHFLWIHFERIMFRLVYPPIKGDSLWLFEVLHFSNKLMIFKTSSTITLTPVL